MLAHWGAIIAIFYAAHRSNHWLGYLLGLLFISGLQHGLVNLAHDAWHHLCFRPRRLNDAMGSWIYGYPVGIPFFHDRSRHLQHHRRIGYLDDPDRVNYENNGRAPLRQFIVFLLAKMAGGQLWQVVSSVAHRKPRIALKQPTAGPSVFAEYAAVTLCQLVLLASFTLAGRWWEYFVLWFLPLATLAPLWAGIRAFVEHSSHEDEAAAEERLYDFHPSLLEAFFISPCHFNYHALHHSYPTVPHYRLKTLKNTLHRQGPSYIHRDEQGYFSYLVRYFAEYPDR